MARAKDHKSTQKRGSYIRCATPKCRKKARKDSDLCESCFGASYPHEVVQRVTDVEALSFNSLDVEIRNHAQGIQILNFEANHDALEFQKRQKSREARKAQLQQAIASKKAEYTQLVNDIAKKYDMDPEKWPSIRKQKHCAIYESYQQLQANLGGAHRHGRNPMHK